MGQPFRILEGVYMVGSSDISHSMDCCVYLVDAGELVLIDAGAGKSTGRILDNIQTVGFQPEKLSSVIVTHAHIDHVGSLYDLRESYGVKVIAHRADVHAIETGDKVGAAYYGVKYKPCHVDIIIDGEESTLKLGAREFRLLHIPGHTPGSMSVILQASGNTVLFGQDIHGPYHQQWGGDPKLAVKSLEKLRDLKADILCEGHYGVIKPETEITEFIQEFIDGLKRA